MAPQREASVVHRLRSDVVAGVRRGHRDTSVRQPLGDGTTYPPGAARDECDTAH